MDTREEKQGERGGHTGKRRGGAANRKKRYDSKGGGMPESKG